jgi:preprotein translocase subunit Sss1
VSRRTVEAEVMFIVGAVGWILVLILVLILDGAR